MSVKKQVELVRLCIRLQEVTDSLHAQAADVYKMVGELEELTKDTTIRFAGLRVKVEARAAFEQAKDLGEALEETGKERRGQA